MVRRQAIRHKRSGGDNDVSYATSKRPRHETATQGIQASSTGPKANEAYQIDSSHQVGNPFIEAEGHTAHVCPAEQGSHRHIGQNVPLQRASDIAGLNDGQFNEEVWEDVLDGCEAESSSTVIISDAKPIIRRRSSNTPYKCPEHPIHASSNNDENDTLNYSANGDATDLAYTISSECLPSIALQPHIGAGSTGGEVLEAACSDLFNFPVMELLQYALSGASLDVLNDKHFQAVKMAADFLFSAGLIEDAFVVYHWIYESLKNAPPTKPDLLFSAIIDLARSAATASQDYICRKILTQTLHDRTARKERESQETFLLHAFLTMLFRRQEDLAKADFHCHRALACFLLPKKQRTPSKNAWQSLAWTALSLLKSSLTEHRLSQFNREFNVEHRQRVLSRASDHLINASQHLWSGDIQTPGASCSVNGVGCPEIVIEEHATRMTVLKELLDWCAQALERAKLTRSLRQSWRKVRKSGTNIRDVSIATLYCILHQQWREENAAASLTSSYPPSWTSRAQSEFDLMPHDCLAAVPKMLAITWPYSDEEMPLLSNWRTCLFELQKHARREIEKLLRESDITVAHLFFQANSGQAIPSADRPDMGSVQAKALRVHILQICSTRFSKLVPSKSYEDRFELDAVNFQRGLDPCDHLPSLAPSRDNSPLSRSHLSLTRRTSMHSHPSNRSKGSRRSLRIPLRSRSDASMNSNSSGLASMKSLSKRISLAMESREQELPSEPPSAVIPDMIHENMDLENLMGTASKSLEALSLDPENWNLAVEV